MKLKIIEAINKSFSEMSVMSAIHYSIGYLDGSKLSQNNSLTPSDYAELKNFIKSKTLEKLNQELDKNYKYVPEASV